MNKHSLQEKYLIFRIKHRKDPDAYARLYDFYVERIFRFIRFKVRSVEEAEDICSEVFLKTWQYIRSAGKRVDNVNALLYRMARNAVIDAYRKKQRQDVQLSDAERFSEIMAERTLEEEVDRKIEVKNIENYLDRLKDEYREAIILRYIEDFSIGEIAEILQKTKSNVRVILHRAVERLRKLMD
jgi:RNA polymerase sigma-70 factor (ECF subfamily)